MLILHSSASPQYAILVNDLANHDRPYLLNSSKFSKDTIKSCTSPTFHLY